MNRIAFLVSAGLLSPGRASASARCGSAGAAVPLAPARPALLALALIALASLVGCARQQIGMDYQIKVDRGAEAGEHVPETAVFRGGEKFRLRITARDDGYLYVFNKGASGNYNLLYPRSQENNGSAFVPGHASVSVPAKGWFQFAGPTGVETLIVCFGKRAVPDLETIARGQETDPRKIEGRLHAFESDSQRGGRFEKKHHADHTEVILELPQDKADAVLVNTIRLEHRPMDAR